MSSTYGPRVSDAISGLPLSSEQATAIHDQIGAAIQAAGEIGGAPGRALADVASRGFADGMSTAFIIGAVALALGAVIVALFLPARARDHELATVAAAGDGQGKDNVPVAAASAAGDGQVRSTAAEAAAGDGQRSDTPAGAPGDGHRRAAPAPGPEPR
jgi:hypothetical protein